MEMIARRAAAIPDHSDSPMVMIDIDSIVPWAGNPRQNDEAAKRLAVLIQEHGFVNPVIIWSGNGVMYAGHTRVKAARLLGMTRVPARFIAFESEEKAIAFGLADNRANEWASWDVPGLVEQLNELESVGIPKIARMTGFEQEEVEGIGTWVEQPELSEKEQHIPASFPIFSADDILATGVKYYRSTPFDDIIRLWLHAPPHWGMQEINKLASTEEDKLWTTHTGLAVANSYHPHRLDVKKSDNRTMRAQVSNDRALSRPLQYSINENTVPRRGFPGGYTIGGGIDVASNFRPGFALAIYRHFCPKGGFIFDASAGFGGRLIGFLAWASGRYYMGVDPSTPTFVGNNRLITDYHAQDRAVLVQQPIEDVNLQQLKSQFDIAFTSPPYFNKERYTDEQTQSWMRYKSTDKWREGFLRRMLQAQFTVLKPMAFNIVNIASVRVKGQTYDLPGWTCELAQEIGFKQIDSEIVYTMPSSREIVSENTDDHSSVEPILVFQKP
jgi:hypothetical protein